jgi:hypothetical protein
VAFIAAGVSAATLALFFALAAVNDVSLLVLKRNLLDGIDNGTDWGDAFSKAIAPVFSWWAPVMACLVYFALTLKDAGERQRVAEGFLLFACAIVLIVSILASAKVGTSTNKYARFMLLAILAMGYLSQSRQIFAGGTERYQSALRWSFCAWTALYISFTTVQHYAEFGDQPTRRSKGWRDFKAKMRKELRNDSSWYFLSSDAHILVMFPQNAYVPQPDLAVTARARGLVSYDKLQAEITNGNVRFAVARSVPHLEKKLDISLPHFKKKWSFFFGNVYENPASTRHRKKSKSPKRRPREAR